MERKKRKKRQRRSASGCERRWYTCNVVKINWLFVELMESLQTQIFIESWHRTRSSSMCQSMRYWKLFVMLPWNASMLFCLALWLAMSINKRLNAEQINSILETRWIWINPKEQFYCTHWACSWDWCCRITRLRGQSVCRVSYNSRWSIMWGTWMCGQLICVEGERTTSPDVQPRPAQFARASSWSSFCFWRNTQIPPRIFCQQCLRPSNLHFPCSNH